MASQETTIPQWAMEILIEWAERAYRRDRDGTPCSHGGGD